MGHCRRSEIAHSFLWGAKHRDLRSDLSYMIGRIERPAHEGTRNFARKSSKSLGSTHRCSCSQFAKKQEKSNTNLSAFPSVNCDELPLDSVRVSRCFRPLRYLRKPHCGTRGRRPSRGSSAVLYEAATLWKERGARAGGSPITYVGTALWAKLAPCRVPGDAIRAVKGSCSI